jgi:parvulin-like peptidyl-prolyl isomerase
MKRYPSSATVALSLALIVLAPGTGATQDLPVVKGRTIVARVQGEPITLDELNRQVAAMKGGQASGSTVDRSAELALLHRMITTLLIAQEARRMELDKVPEIRRSVDSFARVSLREELVERVVKDVKADPKEVDRVYRDSVAEWKVSAALFAKEEHATGMAAAVKAGGDFGELARAYLAQGTAAKVEDGVVLKRQTMDPAIGKAIETLAVGSASPVISIKSGFVVLKLEDIRHPDDPAARAAAEQIVLTANRKGAVSAFDEALRKKYGKIDRELLKGIDYESDKPGIEALLKDRRVLAEIKGEKPITVAELTEELKFQFFHGTGLAAERKRLNARKEQVLDGILHRKVFRKEALRLKLDKTDAYRDKLKEYESAALFEAFLRKAIVPDVKLTAEEVRTYYDDHRSEYTSPEMMRIKGLVFTDRASAEAAMASLQKGADFQWVASHADAQIAAGTAGVLSFDGKAIMTTELPDGVRKAVAGARTGDARLYASPEKHFYALLIERVVEAAPQPFEQVRGEIAKKVLAAKVQKAVEEYAEKLRALSEVRVYLKGS